MPRAKAEPKKVSGAQLPSAPAARAPLARLTENRCSHPQRPREEPGTDLASLVETAEIDVIKERISSGTAKEVDFAAPLTGLARVDLEASDAAVLEQLHRVILDRLESDDRGLASWGGIGDKSTRRRGYGYLAGTPISESHYDAGKIMMRECTRLTHPVPSPCPPPSFVAIDVSCEQMWGQRLRPTWRPTAVHRCC